MENNGRRREKAALRRAAATVESAHGEISRLQIPTAAETNLPRQRQESQNHRIQGTFYFLLLRF